MPQIILCKLGEMVLKGLNRNSFEHWLRDNLKRRLGGTGYFSLKFMQSCLYVEPYIIFNEEAMYDVIGSTFGIVSYTPAHVLEKNMDILIAEAPALLRGALAAPKSFKVEAKRADKRFPYNSPQIMQQLGGALHDAFPHLTVDVHHPECTVVVEVREQNIYLHTDPRPGAGGLPVGTSGTGTLLLSGGIDSPVAGYLMARRGLRLHAVHFESYPYTAPAALEKVETLARQVAKYAGSITLDIVSFTAVQERLRAACREAYFTLLMRRSMMRVAAALAHQHCSQCLITGESLGQVASQTVGALSVTNDAIPNFDDHAPYPVFRPCIGMDKEEIVAIARKIGTFETSILPYEDCCTVFTPRHPVTRPVYAEVLAQEALAELDDLEQTAINHVERKGITWH